MICCLGFYEFWACVVHSIEECAVIKEKVKKYIAEQNARVGTARSGSGDTEAPPTPTNEAPEDNAAQNGVDN